MRKYARAGAVTSTAQFGPFGTVCKRNCLERTKEKNVLAMTTGGFGVTFVFTEEYIERRSEGHIPISDRSEPFGQVAGSHCVFLKFSWTKNLDFLYIVK